MITSTEQNCGKLIMCRWCHIMNYFCRAQLHIPRLGLAGSFCLMSICELWINQPQSGNRIPVKNRQLKTRFYVPVLNAKSISVLGKSNSKSRYQYWFIAMIKTHLRLVRLGQDLASLKTGAKIKFRTRIEPTLSISLGVCPSYCAAVNVASSSFAPF